MFKPLAALAVALALTACVTTPRTGQAPLGVAAWNMEHLSEDGSQGCKARTDADYAVMARYAEQLKADVIAFEEVESVKAAARVFDPAKYQLVIEEGPAGEHFPCGGQEGRRLTRQAVGFAIRKGVSFDRAPDVSDLALGNPNLRAGVDITVRAPGHAPLRLLAVHLKSGCFNGLNGGACATLQQQIPVLERWIDARAAEPIRFAVLGDFNRRLARADDVLWAELDDGQPANADLSLAEGAATPKCDPRYKEFIDHIVLDARATRGLVGFEEQVYAAADGRPSDHCPVVALLR
ncbi:endonuclease/exonuclease/phosphatase family protein [Caulobacter sp. CCNWLY153]|uniref:Endonuclease n=1 Tax=Caulobacter radicis TaxID=2172650 RepID=A0A2T9IVL5_9CAUL|nr:endonuclease/exonuclease/phosphatase family protein [Caulobacter radicis]PVM70906.1 endonuclease [Caulobacter radicis]